MTLKKVRLHGKPPYTIVAVHGGPGAVGEARPFAEELARSHGVIEPLLVGETLDEQCQELLAAIKTHATEPVVLAGHSYGALLSYLFAADHPTLVRKLVMISSALLDPADAEKVTETRLSRLEPAPVAELEAARATYKQAGGKAKERAFVRLFTLIKQADAYDPLPHDSDLVVVRPHLYGSVWEGVQALRDADKLTSLGRKIVCPVVAIHGDYDPRPAESVRGSLAANVKNLEFAVVEHCGHYPWYERQARDEFYRLLQRAVA